MEEIRGDQRHKFKGGIRVDGINNTWPFAEFEIGREVLILRDTMFKKEYKFSKSDITSIEIVKVFPIIGRGIQIHHVNGSYNRQLIFWYVGWKLKDLLSTLKETGWLEKDDQKPEFN